MGVGAAQTVLPQLQFRAAGAATEDAIILSLGPQHSFPLEDVFQYLKPATAEHLLVQAMLDAPVFGTRWRWNATRALAVLRFRGGRKVPTPLQRMEAEDLVAAVFPDQLACPETRWRSRNPRSSAGQSDDRRLPARGDGFPGLKRVLEGMEAGQFTLIARDTTEPSPLCHEVLNARPYAFLDDAPLEERRTQAVITRRGLDVKTAEEFGKLDQTAIDLVREQAWPDPENADELHDALLVMGVVPQLEAGKRTEWAPHFAQLLAAGRATTMDGKLWSPRSACRWSRPRSRARCSSRRSSPRARAREALEQGGCHP